MRLNISNTFYMTLQEKRILKRISRVMLWMIEYRALISNSEQFTHKNLLRAGISSNENFGWISINCQLSLYNNNLWTEVDETGTMWWVFKIIGISDIYIIFNSDGEIIQKPTGGRKYLIQFAKHVPILPCDGKQININELLRFYEASNSIFKL